MNVATGFLIVITAVLVGYVIGRARLLGEHAPYVLSRLVFYVLSPFLLFTVLSQADVSILFSQSLLVSAIVAIMAMVVYGVIARLIFKRDVGDSVIGAYSAGYVNAGNIGIPISLYLLGNAAYPAPVTLVQLLILMPIALTILESRRGAAEPFLKIVWRTARSPIIVASALGVAFAVSGIKIPDLLFQPINAIAQACVPIMLISYGMALHGQRVLTAVGTRRDAILASSLNLILMPVMAWALSAFVFQLPAHQVLVVTTLAALPTAQNVFNLAQRFEVGQTVARDTIFITTVLSMPVMAVIHVLLG